MAEIAAVQHSSWTDVEAASGTRSTDGWIPDVLTGTTKRTRALDISRSRYAFGLPLDSPALSTVIHESVVRVDYSGTTPATEEWRVREIEEDVDERNGEFARVTCDHVGMDLLHRSEILERVDGGISFLDFEHDGPPSEHLGIMLGTLGAPFVTGTAPAHFAAGTVSITEPVLVRYNRMRIHEAIVELLKRLRALGVTVEWTVLRNGATNWLVDIVPEVNISASVPRVEVGRSVVSFSRSRDSVEQATVVVPTGGNHPAAGGDDFRLGIAENHFRVAGVSGDDLTLSHDIVIEDDQWNGFYVEEPDGTFTQITDSAAPNQITATGHGVAVDELVSIRRNSAGDELSGVRYPSKVTTYGAKAKPLDRGDIPYVNNWIPNPWFRDWTDGGKGDPFFLPPAPAVLSPKVYVFVVPKGGPKLPVRGGGANGLFLISSTAGGLAGDSFDRADASSLGFTWWDTVKGGTSGGFWEIDTNKAQIKSTKAGWARSLVIPAADEFVLRADVSAGGGQVFLGRWIDDQNWVMAGIGLTSGDQKLKILANVAGSQSEWASVDISPDDTTTGEHTLKVWLRDGAQDVWYDFGAGGAVTASSTETGLDGLLGMASMYANHSSGNQPTVDDFEAATTNVITATGLAAGEQLDIDGNETVESSGTATWALGGVDFPLATAQIEASGGSPVTAGPYSPTGGIYPGSQFSKA